MREKTAKNPRQVTLSRFRSSNELLQERKKEEPVSKDKNADIPKWFKKKETSTVVKDDRKAEKDKTVVVIDRFFEPGQGLSNVV